MRNWDRVVDEYLEMYGSRGLSPETVKNARRQLDRLGCWLKSRRPRLKLESISSEELIAYIRSRTSYRAKATVSGLMSTLRGFGEYLVQQNIWPSNPLRWMKGPRLRPGDRIPRRINGTAIQKLWAEAASGRQAYHRHLWLAALALLYGTGLRRGELHRLNVSSWCSEEGTLRIDGRKTGQERQVAVPELTWRCIESYLPQRLNHLEELGLTRETALLVNKDGGRLSGSSISRALKVLADRADIGRVTAHQFRHSCASELLEKGVKLPQVQQMLGHQTISTTVRYLHIADPARHEAVSRHPINEILRPAVAHAMVGGAA
jgi:site-specific recombinase XerD